MKQTTNLFFLFLLVFTISFSLAQPPFQQTSVEVGLVVQTTYTDYHMLGQDYEVHTHVYNATTGLIVNTALVNCSFHAYDNANGSYHILKVTNMDKYGVGYNYTMNGSYFNEIGSYSIMTWCYSATEGGFFQYTFDVIEDSAPLQPEKTNIYLFISLMPLVLTVIFFFFGYMNFKVGDKDENNVISLFFYGLGFAFVIVHLIITNVVLQNVLVMSVITEVHTTMMIAVLMVVGLIVGYAIVRIILQQVDNFYKRSGLK